MPNSATMSSLLQTCGGLGLLLKGKEAHFFSIKRYYIEVAYIVTALISMYSKSGNLRHAEVVFRKIVNKTLASWNYMIMGLQFTAMGKRLIHFLMRCVEQTSARWYNLHGSPFCLHRLWYNAHNRALLLFMQSVSSWKSGLYWWNNAS